jgi:hypothetical protein
MVVKLEKQRQEGNKNVVVMCCFPLLIFVVHVCISIIYNILLCIASTAMEKKGIPYGPTRSGCCGQWPWLLLIVFVIFVPPRVVVVVVVVVVVIVVQEL